MYIPMTQFNSKIPFALGVIVSVLPVVTENCAVDGCEKHNNLSATPDDCQITAYLMLAIVPPDAVQTIAAQFQRNSVADAPTAHVIEASGLPDDE